MLNSKVILTLLIGCLVQISVAQDFKNLLESEYADTASLTQFYIVTNNSIDQYIEQESFRDALNLVEKAITVSRKFDQTDRLRFYYLKASLIHFRLGNANRSLAYLRMFELELENKTSNEFQNRQNIFFDELTRLYQKIEQDSIFNRQLREQQETSLSRENKLFLWLKIILAFLAVSVGVIIYLVISNKKLHDQFKESQNSPQDITMEESVSTIQSDNTSTFDSKMKNAWNQIFDDQIKDLSENSLDKNFNSFLLEEGDDLSPVITFSRLIDNNNTLVGFFSLQSTNNNGNVHLIALINSIKDALSSELESTGMIMTLIDQNFSKYISQSQMSSVPVFGGVFFINRRENQISFTGAGIQLHKINKTKIESLESESAPLGSTSFKNQFYSIKESPLIPGDWIYIFSPGIYNQFGGSNKQPLGRDSFLNFLKSIVTDSTENQQFMIRKVFREWKGPNPQTDVTGILGIKI